MQALAAGQFRGGTKDEWGKEGVTNDREEAGEGVAN